MNRLSVVCVLKVLGNECECFLGIGSKFRISTVNETEYHFEESVRV